MIPDATVSALLPLHGGVDPADLLECLRSLLTQTRPLDEIVIVEDGPLSTEHVAALHWTVAQHPRVIRIALPVNRGAGVANQVGLLAATSEWVLKVDADDINDRSRVEAQLTAAVRMDADACGTSMLEFRGTPDNVVAFRGAPCTHDGIRRKMPWNNPMNHPTVIFRRDVALLAGGYPPWRYMQDYGLFARMLARGAVMRNIEEPYVLFRASDAVSRRRRSSEIRRLEVVLQRELRSLGIVGLPHAMFNVSWRIAARMLPARTFALVQRWILARPVARTSRAHVTGD